MAWKLFRSAEKGGMEQRELTVLLSRVHGFNTIADFLGAEELLDLLDQYVTAMHAVIAEHQGRIGCNTGNPDSILAVFGDGKSGEVSSLAGCRAALGMMNALRTLQAKWQPMGLTEVRIGIVVDTGLVWMGTVGLLRAPHFHLVGDVLNQGGRLLEISRLFSVPVVIGKKPRDAIRYELACRELPSIRVRGKKDPVQLFELMQGPLADSAQREFLDKFEAALASYKVQKWDEAIAAFSELSTDTVSQMYVERCQQLRRQPPGSDWDGLFKPSTR